MEQMLEIVILVGIVLFLVFYLRSKQTERESLQDVWQAFANRPGWQLLPRPEPAMANDAAIVIVGTQSNRHVEVAGYRHYFKQSRPEYMEITIELNNTTGLVMKSGFWVRLLESESRQPRPELHRVKSGDRNFDSSYRIKGYPEGVLRKILASNDVQGAIKTIYPTSTQLLHTAFMQIQGDKLALRLERLYYTEEGLREFIEQSCALAEAIEASMQQG